MAMKVFFNHRCVGEADGFSLYVEYISIERNKLEELGDSTDVLSVKAFFDRIGPVELIRGDIEVLPSALIITKSKWRILGSAPVGVGTNPEN